MDEDGNGELTFDEVDMQDMIDDWSRIYAEGVKVDGWYYDCHKQVVLIRLLFESEEEDPHSKYVVASQDYDPDWAFLRNETVT
jgi:hypothetical protein